ncbi:non-ribosomal peptide synthetase [Paenibacillus arenosi]|uniref:Amino acid adenylation domain-containing protein n=1 Tax=Paenibacillus arenosi TaxID=2774142 RepID=A0ABR9AS38_9BACL|nr:non-ribosomal peptide synthetase [Paenibacillus arenosi]MBD8496930.1 amino acid adenylation domain-containing protein [Paenibacillus arenosi]
MKPKQLSMNQMIIAHQHAREKEYWQQQLDGEIGLEGFPNHNSLAQVTGTEKVMEAFPFMLPEAIAAQLIKRGNQSDYAVHVILLSGIAALLHKYTGSSDMIIGAPIYKQVQETGNFINTMLPLRAQVDRGTSFKELLMQVKQTLAAAIEHQNYPVEALFEQLHFEDGESGLSMYRTVVMLENIHPRHYLGDADCKLLFRFVREEDRIRGTVEYDASVYAQAGLERLLAHYYTFMEQALLQVGASIGELTMLPEEERAQILFTFNGKKGFCPDTTMSQLFEEQVTKAPDAIAATCVGISLTYTELNEQANQLAWLLKEKGIGRDRLVAVLFERSIEMLVGTLAIFKAGGAYVPIDVNYPMERIHTVLADSRASVVLTMATAYPDPAELCQSIVRGTSVEHLVYLDKLAQPEFGASAFRAERLAWLLEQRKPFDLDLKMQDDVQVDAAQLDAAQLDAAQLDVGESQLSHAMCYRRSEQLARFFEHRLGSEPKRYPVGVLAEDPMDRITALSALQRLGVDYAVVRNMKEAAQWIQEGKVGFFVTTSQHVDQVDRLFWEQETLHGYVLLDEYDSLGSVKQSQVQDIWEVVAGQSGEAINDYGWSSSFGGNAFRLEEMQEYIDNFQAKLTPYLTKESKVFEIGCGHGIVLFQLAPSVKSYVATDLSGTIIERNRERAIRESLHHVELKQAAAAEIGCLDVSDVDAVVVSSVVHYFPNTLYLEEVIRSAIGLLKEEGIIYLDDLLDAGRKQELVASTAAYKQANPTALVKTGWDEDLFVDERFFAELQRSYPEIISWESSRKRGMIDNELTRFRYDVLLKIDKKQNRREEVVNSDQLLGDSKGRYTWKEVHQLAVGTGEVDTRNDTHEGIEPYTSNTSKNHSGALLVEAAAWGTVTDVSTMTAMPKHNPPSINKPDDLSYVIYTSGSTGRPKGAMVEHRGMINHLYAKQNDFAVSDTSIIAQNASHCFDISVWQMFLGLVLGGSVVIYPNEVTLDADTFIHQIEQDGITILEVVPSYLSVLLDQLEPERNSLANLKLLVVTGEALKPALVDRWFTKYPGIQLANAYGPTEASDDITHYMMDRDPLLASIPVGYPIQNMTIYIVDQGGQLSPIGIKGEIWVSGIGVGRGYVNQPEKTKEAFGEDPFSTEPGMRLYKTGDIGRWMEDGSIDFLGRKDHQVKIRGHRIELGEVENRLAELPGVKESVVTVSSRAGEESFLCAYVTGTTTDISVLKKQLTERLPDYMVPEYVVLLERLPLTPNGKVDRKALLEPDGETVGGMTSYKEPSTDIERKLAVIWSEVLGIEQVGVNDSFFDLGGHSLKMMSISGKIQKEYGYKITMNQIFEYPTIKALSNFIEQHVNKENSLHQLEFIPIQSIAALPFYEVSSAQKRIYLLNRIDNVGLSYNISAAFIIKGLLDRTAVERCFHQLLVRHEALRTSFVFHNNELVQRIAENVPFELVHYRASEEQVGARIGEFVKRFDLAKAPLFRAGLVEIAVDKHILLFDQHHIISDGISQELLIEEFIRLYNGETLASLPIQYKDFAVWQNQIMKTEKYRSQESYWLNVFDQELANLNLPLDYVRPKQQSYEGNIIDFALDPATTGRLHELARNQGLTLYMVLLTAFHILLSKYAAQEDIVIGSPIAGRQHPDVERMVGVFINILCMRNKWSAEQTIGDFLQQVKINTLNAYEHQDYPYEELVAQLNLPRDASRNPLFDVMFVLQNMSVSKMEMNGLDVGPYEYNHTTTQFDLKLDVTETEEQGLLCTFEYSTQLFKPTTIQHMAERFELLVNQMIDGIHRKVVDICLVTEKERAQIHAWNDTAVDFTKGTIHSLFEKRVQQTPNEIAIVHGEQTITYKELNERANQLARLLQQIGIQSNERVGLCAVRNPNMIIGILGILKAGACYVPLDPDYPLQRKQYILNHCGARKLIVEGVKEANELLHKESDLEVVISLEDGDSSGQWKEMRHELKLYTIDDIQHHLSVNLDLNHDVESLMYVMYTSGSTGVPKGVMVTHANVSNYVQWSISHFGLSADDNMMLVTSMCFDISVFEMFGALLSTATLHILDIRTLHDPKRLLAYICEHQIHVWHSVPTLITQALLMLDHYEDEKRFDLRHVRLIMLGGEAWSTTLAEQIRTKFLGAQLYNMYGPTEATIWVTSFQVPAATSGLKAISIGTPIANNQIWIMDDAGQLCGVGIPGHIYVSGTNVTPGYYNNAAETASKFVFEEAMGMVLYRTGDIGRYLADGNIEFYGRNDNMVKVRGYRIETGEIEQALLRKQEISETVVVVRQYQGSASLVCYYVAQTDCKSAQLTAHLEGLLPTYMIPSQFVSMDQLPLTPNGKVDRNALPDPASRSDEADVYSTPANELEERIASVWRTVLSVKNIGVHDDFYQLGGNSLLIIKLEVELEKQGLFSKGIYLTECNTIRKLADRLELSEQGQSEQAAAVTGNSLVYELDCARQVDENKNTYLLPNIEPFNDIFYKNCFYSSAFSMLKYFECDAVDLITDERCVYEYDRLQNRFRVEYVSLQSLDDTLAEKWVSMDTKMISQHIIADMQKAISNGRPVIIWIDCYYASIRADKYQHEHFPHTWLIYGYDETKQIAYIIEQLHSEHSVYEKRTVAFEEVVAAYNGYLQHLAHMYTDIPSYYEFFSSKEKESDMEEKNEIYRNRSTRYLTLIRESELCRSADKDSLQNLAQFIVDFEAMVSNLELLRDKAAQLIDNLNDVINGKRVEKYTLRTLFGEEWVGTRVISEIVDGWEAVRVIIARAHFSASYTHHSLAKAVTMLKSIERLEHEYVSCAFK